MSVAKGQNITESLFPLGLAIVLSVSLMISQGTPLKRAFSGLNDDSRWELSVSNNKFFEPTHSSLSLVKVEPEEHIELSIKQPAAVKKLPNLVQKPPK